MKLTTQLGSLRRFWPVALILFLTTSLPAHQEKPGIAEPLSVDSVLQGPDRVEMPWKVQWSKPQLMYQQRFLLVVKATLPAQILVSGGKHHVVHFIAKVQDSAGKWFAGEQYDHFEPNADLDNTQEIECYMDIYLRPGKFTVAMIAFDETSKKLNVIRRNVFIQPIANDPIPELNSHIPDIEFPSEFPQAEATGMGRFNGELFPIGEFTPLEIRNVRSMRIDIVLNVSAPDRGYRTYRSGYNSWGFPAPPKGVTVGSVVQVGSILSRLAPTNGCVYLTALDPNRMKVALPAQAIEQIDWVDLQKRLSDLDRGMIDARVLQNRKGPGMFMRETLEQMASVNSGCGREPVSAHYMVVVSTATPLPQFSKEMSLPQAVGERTKLYYFYLRNGMDDSVGKILKTATPRRMDFNDPTGFRSALAHFVSDLRSSGN